MKNQQRADEFRAIFRLMDDSCLIDAEEYAFVMHMPSRGSIHHCLAVQPHLLAKPAVRRPRLLRWRVGDVRRHLASLAIDEQRESRRGGRPRATPPASIAEASRTSVINRTPKPSA